MITRGLQERACKMNKDRELMVTSLQSAEKQPYLEVTTNSN